MAEGLARALEGDATDACSAVTVRNETRTFIQSPPPSIP